ncbi:MULTISPECIES: hypothetical protein [Bradyrhizobium]|uniref:hypothetical protein n=1 Tax=Bradyrhizobium TaxID=374 RepID=UPI0004841EE9|nr:MULTISPECIES: hypothetical protein [Bradyrhizobium]MBR0996996.1 hypothetical protein [Bradyrhizobium liaoningense]MCP1740033.1 hypothetical protein [Bradyrhizobium japonicum]MCP1857709.1 hypothetical protein [Bradyrhizobium japonicum]MCP1888523.1 type IV secretory pathway TrbL component [Bradyrhizobium japonicum]MCW2321498.1 hypothetical protein [Bradyrhizobium japonicum]
MLAQADAAGAGMTAESEMFAAKASITRHAAEMRAAAAEAHMSAAKATTAKTGVAATAKATTVAAATATAVRLGRADGQES